MNTRFRFEMADGVYHVTNRGVDRRDIVLDDQDRWKWFHCLGDTATRCGWRVFAYALLTNHFHIFLRTPQPNLSDGMQEFESRYAKFFNQRHDRTGHLFGDRFHAILVEQDGHAWAVSRYLHLNAMRAGLASHPDQYGWSSFPAYMNPRQAPPWLDWRTVLGEIGGSESAARLAYRRFVEAGLQSPPPNPFLTIVADTVLGSESFVNRVLEQFPDRRAELPAPWKRPRTPLTPTDVIERVAVAMETTQESIRRAGRQRNHAREIAVWCCRELTDESLEILGGLFGGVGPSGITETAKRCRERMTKQPAFHDLAEGVRKRLIDSAAERS